MQSLDQSSELVDLIYGALLGANSWHAVMSGVTNVGDDCWITLFSQDSRAKEGMLGSYWGCDQGFVHDYESHFANINPWAPLCAARRPGVTVTADTLIPRDRFVKTEFFADFLNPRERHGVAGLTILKTDERSIMVSLLSSNSEEDTALAGHLERLYPHLRKAAEFYRRKSDLSMTVGLGTDLFEALDIGVAVLGEGLVPKTISATGHAIIETSDLFQITPVGRLKSTDEAVHRRLEAMLSFYYDGPQTETIQTEDAKLTLVRISKDRMGWYFSGPTLVILMEPAARIGAPFDPHWFADRYNLTPAEMRALIGIVDGKSPQSIADEAGVSRETVRTQIKSLYFKSGVHSQAGLLRLIATPRIPDDT